MRDQYSTYTVIYMMPFQVVVDFIMWFWSTVTSFKGFTPPQIKCQDPLGIESGTVPSTAIAASSQYNPYYGPDRGRLRKQAEGSYGGGWAAQYNDAKQFLQFDLGKVAKVTAVATQGRSDANWMVTSYTLAYSVDGGSFIPYGEGDGQVRSIFPFFVMFHTVNTLHSYKLQIQSPRIKLYLFIKLNL